MNIGIDIVSSQVLTVEKEDTNMWERRQEKNL